MCDLERFSQIQSHIIILLCSPLLHIFRKSLDTGTIPQDWKTANVTPISKKVQKQKTNNYRLINLLSQAGKILKSIIRDIMTKFLSENNLINFNMAL